MVFLAFLILNFCQPQAGTLQLAGVVPEKTVVQNISLLTISPQRNFRVYWAPVEKYKLPKWQPVSRPVQVQRSCHVKVTAL